MVWSVMKEYARYPIQQTKTTILIFPMPARQDLPEICATFGYNAMLNDFVELITEVDFNIPEKGENFSVGFSAGLIIAF